MRKRPPSLRTSASAACSSSSLWQTKTPLPAASPSALTTHGALATGRSPSARPRSLALPWRRPWSLRCAQPPPTGRRRRRRRGAGGRRARPRAALGPDYHEVDAERRREREQAVCIVRQHRMAGRARRSRGCPAPRAALRARGSARASTRARAHGLRADDEHSHRASLFRRAAVLAVAGCLGKAAEQIGERRGSSSSNRCSKMRRSARRASSTPPPASRTP